MNFRVELHYRFDILDFTINLQANWSSAVGTELDRVRTVFNELSSPAKRASHVVEDIHDLHKKPTYLARSLRHCSTESNSIVCDEAAFYRVANEVGLVVQAELCHHVSAVHLYGARADKEPLADGCIGETFGRQL
jgi:hypothetical protein